MNTPKYVNVQYKDIMSSSIVLMPWVTIYNVNSQKYVLKLVEAIRNLNHFKRRTQLSSFYSVYTQLFSELMSCTYDFLHTVPVMMAFNIVMIH